MDLAEVERICLLALGLPPVERCGFLDRACGSAEVRREVEGLLEARTAAEKLFDSFSVAPEDYGETGAYQIVGRLGEGGMGAVFRARQTEPVAREVAIKIIHPGMASAALVARFLRERQTLALMDHPNIARVHDAGATTRGLPYLVMELLEGENIVQYCESRKLSIRERVALMIPVCRAVQHAHTKGIIHRDIKPSNILVTVYDGRPEPKVIDFGIAKAMEANAGGGGETRAGVMIGTFEYVSPEQAEAGERDVDTRTDIYSLGVLLYQLIAGRLPLLDLNLDHCTYSELLRRIREEMPRPAGAGELDWALSRALEKQRERRYQTADALAADLGRYLAGDPLEAGPPSTAYRLKKLVAKFKFAIAAASIGFVLLLVSLGWMIFALRQERRANESAAALREVVRKIIIDRPAQLATIPNRTALSGQLMRDAEGALAVLSRDTRNDASLEAELAKAYLAIGQAKGPYSATGSQGDPAGAAPYVKKALDLYRKLTAAAPGEIALEQGKLDALAAWLQLQYRLNEPDEGKRAAQELIAETEALKPEVARKVEAYRYESTAYLELGLMQATTNGTYDAIASHRKAVLALTQHKPEGWRNDPARQEQMAHSERELALTLFMTVGSVPEAAEAAQKAAAAVDGCADPSCHMRLAQALGTLGEIEWASGQRDEGRAALRRGLREFEALSAEDPANMVFLNAAAQLRDYLALTLEGSQEAVTLAARNIALIDGPDGTLARGHERWMVHHIVFGAALDGVGRYADGERELRRALGESSGWNPNADLVWSAFHELVLAGEATGKFAQALGDGRREWTAAETVDADGLQGRLARAIAARDVALAAAHWTGATPADRSQALDRLNSCCANMDQAGGTLLGALIAEPPTAAEIAALRKQLAR